LSLLSLVSIVNWHGGMVWPEGMSGIMGGMHPKKSAANPPPYYQPPSPTTTTEGWL
jgi:hypothetical protein